jgi:hypothetical protein
MKSTTSLLSLTVCLCLLLGYNFMSAAWTAPTGTPPANNAEAPINVSATTQTKTGNLIANIFAAADEMRSNAYCDSTGNNCFGSDDVTAIVQTRTCPSSQFMRGVNADGTLVCATATTTSGSSCTTQTKTVSSCGGTPSCGTGWSKTGGTWGGGKCSTNNDYVYQSCIRTVCS